MSDEHLVPETLETIAAKIDALSKSMDARFDRVDARFEQVDERLMTLDGRITKEIAEAKAQLGLKIEALGDNVTRVYDELIAQRAYHKRNAKEHSTFVKRLDDHDTRILALERKKDG